MMSAISPPSTSTRGGGEQNRRSSRSAFNRIIRVARARMPESVSGQSFLSRISTTGGNKEYNCTIQLLDDSEAVQTSFKKNDTAQALLDFVCNYLQLVEKDYFGLRFMDMNKNRYWVDVNKPVLRQIHGLTPIVFCFRVRYYPANPSVLKEEITRYQLFLQLRRDMLHGRLYCPQTDAAYLGACVVQSEVGDWTEHDLPEGYVSEYKLFLKQTQKIEDRVAQVHKTMSGKNPAEAELDFLKRSALLDTYGFDPYTVKDVQNGNQVYVGVTHQGVLIYHTNRKIHHIDWEHLDKVDYVAKEFRLYPTAEYHTEVLKGALTLQDADTDFNLQPARSNGDVSQRPTTPSNQTNDQSLQNKNDSPVSSPESAGKKRAHGQPLKYVCPSATFAKHLWKHTLAQQAFFTLPRAANVKHVHSKARIPILARGSTFKYSGRVLTEILEETKPVRDNEPSFVRYHVERQPGRDERAYPWMNKYATLPRSTKKSQSTEDENMNHMPSNSSHEAPELGRDFTLPTSSEQRASPDLHMSPISEKDLFDSANGVSQSVSMNDSLIANAPGYESKLNLSQSHENQTPLANSTPIKHEAIVKMHKFEKSTPQNTLKQSNGGPTASTVVHSAQPSMMSRCVRTLFDVLVFVLLLVLLVIVILEIPHRGFRQYVDSLPRSSELRLQYYQPIRDQIVKFVQKKLKR